MIVVAGETLVDLIVRADVLEPVLGGAPSNTAVAVARLGAAVGFAGAISTDRFGDQLLQRLRAADVDTSRVVRTDLPTSLAMADIDDRGTATYRFYFDGTSVPQLDRVEVGDAAALVTGGLGLVLEPMAGAIEGAIADATIPVVVDVNARPAIIGDLAAYRTRLDRVVARTSVLKVSDEDLEVIEPGEDPDGVARRLVDAGAGVVIVTRGAAYTSIVTADDRVDVPVPALPVDHPVVDTIGAGDTFGAGLVTSLVESGALATSASIPGDALVAAVELGHAAAAVTVTRRGADPPTRAELNI
ncbi:MAG: carbohydrate kinase [Actinomycetota bacterium]